MRAAPAPLRVHADVVTAPPKSRRDERRDALMTWVAVAAVPAVLIALYGLQFVGA